MGDLLIRYNPENAMLVNGESYALLYDKDLKKDKSGCVLITQDKNDNLIKYTLSPNINTKSINGIITNVESCGVVGSVSTLEKEVLLTIVLAYNAEKANIPKAILLKICYYMALTSSLNGYLSDMKMRDDLEIENITKKIGLQK